MKCQRIFGLASNSICYNNELTSHPMNENMSISTSHTYVFLPYLSALLSQPEVTTIPKLWFPCFFMSCFACISFCIKNIPLFCLKALKNGTIKYAVLYKLFSFSLNFMFLISNHVICIALVYYCLIAPFTSGEYHYHGEPLTDPDRYR